MAEEIEGLVRRVVGRVLAERGTGPAGGPRPASVGVHVHAREAAGDDRPLGAPGAERALGPAGAKGSGPELVTAAVLARVPDGAVFALAPEARTTPLARDEARRRGIELARGGGAPGCALRVAVGADHGGFALKGLVLGWLAELGHRAFDLGTRDESPVDYPDFAAEVARAVAEGRAEFGVCIDGAGIGSAIAANKVPGVRAATCWDEASARNAREHNFANVLSLGARSLSPELAERVLRAFLATPEGAERHARRVEKIAELERRATGRWIPVRRVRAAAEAENGGGPCTR